MVTAIKLSRVGVQISD